MDSLVAEERWRNVAKADSITTSQADFLATHVPMRRLQLLSRFELQPAGAKEATESDIFDQLIMNPENRHQFIVVYGQSGTGKSHLIRWFETRFRQEKTADEVCLFIRRSDNTLKGTIRQLLKSPEISNIANKDIFDRLSRAAQTEDESKLKGSIYHSFLNEIQNDERNLPDLPTRVTKKRISAFLSNDIVRERLLLIEGGPIDRIYSKVAERQSIVDRDVVAQFLPNDFAVDADLYSELEINADGDTKKMARKLLSDTDGITEAQVIARYLNGFVNGVVQKSAGIEPGDFRQLFQDIRRELYKVGKSLTIFIEDVTSFTGVDDALLDALIVENTGLNEDDGMCRISSIVGTTSNYLQNNFKDNHKDRITQFIHIPSDAFSEVELYEFVGRYLNTMSIDSATIERWASNHALPYEYPVHAVREGMGWDEVGIEGGKSLNLYPFTKNAILYLYKNSLIQGHRTPRYVIKDIIEPAVSEILNGVSSFPSKRFQIKSANPTLSYQISTQVENQRESERLLTFLSIWGTGEAEQYEKSGETILCGISRKILDDLNFPKFNLSKTAAPKISPRPKRNEPEQTAGMSAQPTIKSPNAVVEKANALLTEWVRGEIIDIASSGGASGVVGQAREDLHSFLLTAINWQAQGISADFLSKISKGNIKIIKLANQKRGDGFYTLPANHESHALLSAFISWNKEGNKSWGYPGSDLHAYLVTKWVTEHECEIINSVVERVAGSRFDAVGYIDAAIASEIIRKVLCGERGTKKLSEVDLEWLMNTDLGQGNEDGHSSEWTSLRKIACETHHPKNNQDTIRQFFNLVQGKGGNHIVLDRLAIDAAIKRVASNDLAIPDDSLNQCADLGNPFKPIIEEYRQLFTRLEKTAEAEKAQADAICKPIFEAFEDGSGDSNTHIDSDTIIDLVNTYRNLVTSIDKAQLNVTPCDPNIVSRNAKKIASALNASNKAVKKQGDLEVLQAFSDNPLSTVIPLGMLIRNIEESLTKTDKRLEEGYRALGEHGQESQLGERYQEQLETLGAIRNIIEEEVGQQC